ncbi:hypothetical protein WJX77_009797 [Trebouxia sp. C0004]
MNGSRQTRQQSDMTNKAKRGAGKGKKAAAPAAKAEPEVLDKVVEVSQEARASPVNEGKGAPPPEASMAATDQAAAQENCSTEQEKPTEDKAEIIAEQLVAQARKPMKKESSQSSLAGSVTGTEIDRFQAPEEAAAEEDKLRVEREEKEKQQIKEAILSGEGGALDSKKYKKLDELLNQTDMYTQFLMEHLNDASTATEEVVEAEDGKAGSKRKAGKAGGKNAKRQKPASPTQVMLPLIVGEMRDYQLRGVRWMISLYQNGLNGILADQMGLGKTVQTIGFLSHLREKNVYGPFMVVGPLSTLSNWVDEFKRWLPSMNVILYHGSKDERQKLRTKHMPHGPATDKFPVVVTSYEIVIADSKLLQRYKWKYVVVDEGHRLKNFNCKLLRELRLIPVDNKLLLTGTPLQNNLSELWSLLNFLLPDIFADLANFESWFDFSGVGEESGNAEILAQQQHNKVITKLHSILKPFLLRRVKSDVENSLPGKKELIVYADMTQQQRDFNEELRQNTLNETMAAMAKSQGGAHVSVSKLNNVLMQMRKNCNHPDLIKGAFDGSITYPPSEEIRAQCGKMQLLERMLQSLHKGGHKVLIFSQMTKMLDLLDAYLEGEGHQTCRIDGSVSWQDRQEAIRSFNTDPNVFVFLLSTRAGGLGINLTSADTVIIYDSDWNPHQDMQAMDRAHRIGQTRPVLVFRLATAHSVEGRLLQRANSKLMLERLVIKQGAFLDSEAANKSSSNLSADELLELLNTDKTFQDKAQSGVVTDKVLKQLLDRGHMVSGKPGDKGSPQPYADVGVGYEVVKHGDGSGLLAGVNQ